MFEIKLTACKCFPDLAETTTDFCGHRKMLHVIANGKREERKPRLIFHPSRVSIRIRGHTRS